jgi:RNA polymerase sigma-70 factor, ECF subfamily
MPPHEGPTVGDLIARARAGDRPARDQLFALSVNYVRVLAQALIESHLRAKADPSDLVQQTFLDACNGFGRFAGGTSGEWLAWLRRILDHNAADFVRRYRGTDKRQVSREVALGEPGFDPLGAGESPSQALLRKERELQVADALVRLPEDYREVILLRNLQRLPFEEVAQRMGRSRPAIQMLWLRAMRKLQEDARLKLVAP